MSSVCEIHGKQCSSICFIRSVPIDLRAQHGESKFLNSRLRAERRAIHRAVGALSPGLRCQARNLLIRQSEQLGQRGLFFIWRSSGYGLRQVDFPFHIKRDISHYLMHRYNRIRPHQFNDGLSAAQYEKNLNVMSGIS